MAVIDLNEEWLGHVQPVGLVIAPVVLARHGLNPETQTRADSEQVRKLIVPKDDAASTKSPDPCALKDPWTFFEDILGWRANLVAGSPGGLPLPEDLSLRVDESDTEIAPQWAVVEPDGGWQILVRIEAAGIKPDQRGAIEGWEASPHQRLERLLREKEVPIGLLITDEELRFIYAPRGETSGWMCFPLRSLGEVGGRPMLGGLKLLLSSFRLYNDAPNRRLPALLKASRDAQAEVSTKLASQVLGALHELLRGLHAADAKRIETLAATREEHLYDGLLTVLLRLVFLLYAEDRDLIPSRTDAAARAFYDQGYGVRPLYARLLDDKAHYPDTMDERRGAWSRLLALFRLVHQGDSTGNWIRGRGGKLFDTAEFPFLQGQERASDPPCPAAVSDGCILRILDLLLNLGGEKLSYRTLDVEQIGSVYETVMGFTIETRTGPALAIRAGKNDRTPVFVDIAALAAKKGPDRAKFLKEEAGRNSLTDKVSKALSAATDATAVIEALRPIVDERGSPGGAFSPPGSPLLQPTDERRRTGSHYTPRSLTAPIVQYAVEPAFERLGPDARPEDVLGLTVCDPAMGSGAFLVEACRALGERLVKAWERWPETRPKIPEDEDDQLHARRLVAQRCLYGVDKNPRAVDLAKLSLWLATLARDHEFTFLDHALKCGDSLVGLTEAQLAALHWDISTPGLPLFRKLVKDRVAEAMKGRAEIQAAPDDTARAIQEARNHALEARLRDIRLMGDTVIAAFFSADKPKARETKRTDVESWLTGSLEVAWNKLSAVAATLRQGTNPLTPFHWEIEFPEVFQKQNPGFDAVVGNPPFMGGTVISAKLGMRYFEFLTAMNVGAAHHCDLVAYFFRRAFNSLRAGGALGLIATNTISQGDTREGGLAKILTADGIIFRVIRGLKWPGEAAVTVNVIHILKGRQTATLELDGRPAKRISAYLVDGGQDKSPERLKQNPYISLGTKIYGQGFLFSATDKGASPLQLMDAIVAQRPDLRSRIQPYVGGDEVNSDPTHASSRFVIFLSDILDEQSLKGFEPLVEIIREKVLPERLKLSSNPNSAPLKKRWWAYQAHRPELYKAISKCRFVIGISQTTKYICFAVLPTGIIYSQKLNIIASDKWSLYACLQSRLHEQWALQFGSTLEDRPVYTIADCYQTFPFPYNFASDKALEELGNTYHDYRAALMVARNEGMTKTYNRFHNCSEMSKDIQRLRELHTAMDRAVLEAYGWNDLAARAEPTFLDDTSEDDSAYQGRLFWPSDFRDEVLARLLTLNAERAGTDRSAGDAQVAKDEEEKTEEADA